MFKKKNIIKYICIPIFLIILAGILSYEEEIQYTPGDYSLESTFPKEADKPDFSSIEDFKAKKKAFIKYMLENIKQANKEICLQKKQMAQLEKVLDKGKRLNKRQIKKLNVYLQYYKVESSHTTHDEIELLKLKAGMVPTSFVLAQAILESGWGTSRFAKNYNNYFGLHCAYKGCGVKAKNADVYLETFSDAAESVLGYYRRLNTGSSFKEFRITRAEVDNNKKSKKRLLDTLENYSELQDGEYKNRLISVIKHNNLTQYDSDKYC
ncbi:BAX protein [Candidatus Francisella endociliophora]|uniref:BAX protein n=1 Tax=Candidatus Francisella endociliophora TaxID=653937 RepID=A0A097ERS4_9GAMM|nr:glucosaminidase domain-containing protein [Francisella sp. FSC1006]AIT10270.1 BAX protein [Francisella sp. FSC1006]